MKKLVILLMTVLVSCERPASGDLIHIELLQKSGHDDLKFSIEGLTGDLTFDSYYFAIATEHTEGLEVKNCLANFIGYWVIEIENMKDAQTRFFPIDISDEYTGCVKITKHGADLEINYGFSRYQGYHVNIENPTQYFNGISDFQSDIPKPIIVHQSEFLNALKSQINKILE
ncbi:MAG: hypothetical protein HYZ44_14905 [Bacteroidetes bacterium]|nr:hypothetical protein [Bacteroidota bacterium]